MSEVVRTGEPLFISSLAERDRSTRACRTRPGGARARRAAARGAGRRLRRPVALVRPRHRVRAGAARAEDRVRAAGGAGARALAALRGRAGAARADVLPRRGERAARLVARLRPDARALAQLVRARPRRLVRDRHPRRRTGRSSGSRSRTRIPTRSAGPTSCRSAIRPTRTRPRGVAEVLRTGEPEFLPRVPARAPRRGVGDDDELRRIVDELGLTRRSPCRSSRAAGPSARSA